MEAKQKHVTQPNGNLRLCPRSLSTAMIPGPEKQYGFSGSDEGLPLTGRPRQPQKRKAKSRAAYSCPICRQTFGLLDAHLQSCFSEFLSFESQNVPTLPAYTTNPLFHATKPVISIPPSEDSEICVLNPERQDDPRFFARTASIQEQNNQGTCPLCAKTVPALVDHIEVCLCSPKISSCDLPTSTVTLNSHRAPIAFSSPPKSQRLVTLTRAIAKIVPLAPTQGKTRKSSFSSAAPPMLSASPSPRSFSGFQQERRKTIDMTSGSEIRKRKSTKKEKATPFNLPLQELHTASPSEDTGHDNKVLKIPISTSAPTSKEIQAAFPDIDRDCFSIADIRNGSRVVIVCLENMSLCRILQDGKVFADGKDCSLKDVRFTLRKKEGYTECKFKSELTHKYLLAKDTFSEINNHITHFNRKKEYHCLYFVNGTNEVILGSGQERSMFRVFSLNDQNPQQSPRSLKSHLRSSDKS